MAGIAIARLANANKYLLILKPRFGCLAYEPGWGG